MGIHAQAEADLRELMGIPSNYKVLFLQGGATMQFAMIPINLLRGKASADYVNTGEWSKKAIKEAKLFGKVNVAASAEAGNFTHVPAQSDWKLDPDAAYVHVCMNETIGGVEFGFTPDTGTPAGALRTPAEIRTPPLVAGSLVLVGLRDRSVIAYALPGSLPADAPAPAEQPSGPVAPPASGR